MTTEAVERTEAEQELRDACKLKDRDWPNRQDELAAILRAGEKIPEKQFDTLSNEAVNWYNAAADAMNEHRDIPDFDEIESNSEDEEAAEDAGDDDDEADNDAAKTDSDADDEDADDEDDESDPDDSPKGDADEDQDEVNPGSVEDEDDEEEEIKQIKKPKAKTGAKDAKPTNGQSVKSSKRVSAKAQNEREDDDDTADEAEAAPVKAKKKKKDRTEYKTPYDRLSGEKDRFGLFAGTQASKAAALYEKGCTVKHVTDVLGGKHRNVLTKLAQIGHTVEKLEGGIYKVTHKDAAKVKKTKSKK